MPCVIGYDDLIQTALLSGGNWVSSLPLTNIQDGDVQTVARSATAQASDTVIIADFGKIQQVGIVVIGPCNITSGATYRIRSFIAADHSVTLYDSGSLTVSGIIVDWSNTNTWLEWEDQNFWTGIGESEVSDLPLFIVTVIPTSHLSETNAQFWQININDADNIDGHIDIGRIFVGPAYRPTLNYAPSDNEFSIEWLTDVSESLSGSRYFWRRGFRRKLRLSWPQLPDSELFGTWFKIGFHSGLNEQIFIVPEENDDAPTMRKRAFLATFKQTPPLAQAQAGYGSTLLDVEEVI